MSGSSVSSIYMLMSLTKLDTVLVVVPIIIMQTFSVADSCISLVGQVAVTPLSLSPYIEMDTQTAASDWISAALHGEQ